MKQAKIQGARCMDCGTPVLQQRLPGQQHHSGLQRPGVPRRLAERHRGAAHHQQLPRVHRPHLPRALRGSLRAEHQQRRRWASSRIEHAIIDRAWAEGWVKPQPAPSQDRQEGGHRRLRPGRPGRGPATGPRRPRRDACSRRTNASAACCASASPTSSSRSRTSTAASSRWKPKAWCSRPAR